MANAAKSIFITGGASGIGRAVAVRFANAGWFVALADIDAAGMAATSVMLPEGMSSQHKLDVRDRDQWQAALAAFWEKTGRLDVLFNNAGVGRGGPLAETHVDDDDLVVDVNIKGVLNGAKAGFEYLAKTPGSCLLNTASAAGIYGAGGMSVYCASKFAVRGITESLDQEWEEHGIKVASLMPAFIDTPILDAISMGSNRGAREVVVEAGLEISPVSLVADAAWDTVHGKALHTRVGKTAHRAWFWSRLAPGYYRKKVKALQAARLSLDAGR